MITKMQLHGRLALGVASLLSVIVLNGCALQQALNRKTYAQIDAENFQKMQAGAEGGNASDQNRYGEYFSTEKKDDVTAHSWFLKSAQQGNAAGEENLAWDYAKGRGGVAQNDATAASWMKKSADQGKSTAEYAMAQMYAEGRGVPKNKAKQIAMLQAAGRQWNYQALHDLTFMGDPGGVAQMMSAKAEANHNAMLQNANNYENDQRAQAAQQNSQVQTQRMCTVNNGQVIYQMPC